LSYYSLKNQTINNIEYLKQKHNAKILVIGFSMGGAIATYSAFDIKKRFADEQIDLITFE